MLSKQTMPPFSRESLASLTVVQKNELIHLLDLLEKNQARDTLIKYCCFVDPLVSKWYRARHLSLLAEYYEAVERGQIQRLIVSMPPGHWKSSTEVKFAEWHIGKHPEQSLILTCHNGDLALEFSQVIRNTIAHNARWRALFPGLRLVGKNVADWSLNKAYRSTFRAAGINSGLTGHRANGILIDDPIASYEEANSQVQREGRWNGYRTDVRTRIEPGGWIVMTLTRWHEDDIAGRLLDSELNEGGEHWEVLNLPAWTDGPTYYALPKTGISDTNKVETDATADAMPAAADTKTLSTTATNLKQPNAKDTGGYVLNGWLWSDRFTPSEYSALQASVGPMAWQALYMGDPRQPEGNLIKESWFEYVEQLPSGCRWRVRAWDVAWTLKQTQKHDPDFTGTGLAAAWENILYLGKPRLFRKSLEDLAADMVESKKREPSVIYGMGKAAIKATVVKAFGAAGFPMNGYDESNDPLVEATAFINWAAQGRVKLVGTKEEWAPTMMQWLGFPTATHNDAVAWVAGVTKMLGLSVNYMPRMRKPEPTLREQIRQRIGLQRAEERWMGEQPPHITEG